MQQVILVYDITEDHVRAKVAVACQDYGLDRIQYSTFCGCLSRNKQEELMLRIEDLLTDAHGNIRLFPISATDWNKQLEIDYAG